MADRIDFLTTRKTVEKDPVFTDFYNNFNVHPQNKRLALHTDEQAVRRSIRNILSTNSKERLFNPEFGGGLRRFLFEDISVMTADLIKDAIKQSKHGFRQSGFESQSPIVSSCMGCRCIK